VTAVTGIDALTHAVESYVCTKRNHLSQAFSREAWRLLAGSLDAVLRHPDDLDARGRMQLGAYFAGMAIENAMLGAAHACANPLTAHYGTAHGAVIAMLLPSVVRWNGAVVASRYAELLNLSTGKAESDGMDASEKLAQRLEQLTMAAGLPNSLRAAGVPQSDLSMLAEEAAQQWTGRFNPLPFDLGGAL